MMEFGSKEEWKNYCFNTHKIYLKNKYFMGWLRQKKVDVFDCSELGKDKAGMVKKTIENVLRTYSKGFIVQLKRNNLNFATKNGFIDGTKVLKMVKKTRKRCSASIFLANKRAKSGKNILKFGDALTYVSDGITIFTFDPSVKYPKRFFREVIAHEIYHLLGLNIHHYDAKVKGYGRLPRCIMEYNAPSEVLCQKCKNGLLSFWEGIKNATS